MKAGITITSSSIDRMTKATLQSVLEALNALRSPFAATEDDLHQRIGQCLTEAGLIYTHEARIGPGCRVDFLVDNVGVEIKKGKPLRAALIRQLARYAACETVGALIVVSENSVSLPSSLSGKMLREVALNRLWGVALP